MAEKKDFNGPDEQNEHPGAPETVADATPIPGGMSADDAVDAAAAPSGDEEARAPDEQSELLAKLDTITAEANEHRDRYLRAVAELENFRRRALREKDEVRKYGNQALLEDFLPLYDNLKLGLQAAEQHAEGKVFTDGFAMVVTQMENWLRDYGVVTIAPEGEAFDPNYHESVGYQPHAEVAEGDVIQVQRVGYRLHDRLIRAATVVVSSGAPKEASS